MLNFLVISPQSPYQKEFRSFLRSLEGVHLKIVDNVEAAKSAIHYEMPQVVLVHLSKLTSASLKGIEQIRRPFDLPVMLFTHSIKQEDLELIKPHSSYYILGRPYLSRDVLGIAFKMAHKEIPEQQLHRRYSTNQFTSMQGIDNTRNGEGNITNMSISGAKIRTTEIVAWEAGDLVKLDIPLSKLRKKHSVHAKVVWIEKQDSEHEIGVEFIPNEQIYSYLLGNV